jgi:ribosomal protein L37AE/L43A
MIYTPRKPDKLGAEGREAEAAAVKDIGRTADVCPECGGTDITREGGCAVCRSCGWSPRGAH